MFGVFLYFIMCCVLVKLSVTEIETYTFDNFPKNKIAVHMPCEESNMFATKCMCHLKCTDPSCKNAKELCKKYEIRYTRYVHFAIQVYDMPFPVRVVSTCLSEVSRIK